MSTVVVVGLILSFGAGSAQDAPAAADGAAPTAQQILSRFVEVTGGQAAREKIHNRVSEGTMEYVGSTVRGKVTFYAAQPAKLVRIIEVPGSAAAREGTDGKIAWEISSKGTRIIDGEALTRRLAEAQFDSDWRCIGRFPVIEALGLEPVDGQPCYKIKLRPTVGPVEMRYYDKATGLLVKAVRTLSEGNKLLRFEESFSEYKPVGGVLVPHEVRRKLLDQEALFRFNRIEHNVELPAGCFDVPKEVAHLLAGPTTQPPPSSQPSPASQPATSTQPAPTDSPSGKTAPAVTTQPFPPTPPGGLTSGRS